MLKITIVDDEKRVRSVIRQILEAYCNNIEEISEAESVETGIKTLKENKPDIVLLDIKLPDGLAFDILSAFQEIPFKIIFITAYNDYAVEAFRLSAVDYLLKPVNAKNLVEAVNKASDLMKADLLLKLNALNNNYNFSDPGRKQLVLKTMDDIYLVKMTEIIHCQADQSYCVFNILGRKKILVSKPMGEFEELLGKYNFFRVHKSHLVNLQHVRKFSKGEGGNLIMTDGSVVPVSFRKKDVVIQKLENL